MDTTIFIVAAHPDDEVLGCGGAIQYHRQQGHRVQVVMVTDGSSTQYPGNTQLDAQKRRECQAANKLLGVEKVHWLNFPDMKLDTVAQVELNQALEKLLDTIQPSILYAHSPHDLNQDHVRIAHSVQVMARPGKPFLQEVLWYEVPSSSEWRYEHPFQPTVFLDISKYLETKIKAFSLYKTEVRPQPHPRSSMGITAYAQWRGLQAGCAYAESFRLVRRFLS